MNYKLFLTLVKDELGYIQAFGLEYEYGLLKAAGALVALKEYIEIRINEESKKIRQ